MGLMRQQFKLINDLNKSFFGLDSIMDLRISFISQSFSIRAYTTSTSSPKLNNDPSVVSCVEVLTCTTRMMRECRHLIFGGAQLDALDNDRFCDILLLLILASIRLDCIVGQTNVFTSFYHFKLIREWRAKSYM